VVAPVDAADPVAVVDAAVPKPKPLDDELDDPLRGPGKREQTWSGPIPPKPAVAPMAPGIHPILVRVGPLTWSDGDPTAYFVLACAKVEKNKPAIFLDGAKCLPLMQNVQLELVLEKSRVPVRVIGRGTGHPCMEGSARPTVKIAGLPKDKDGQLERGIIVSKGMAQYEGPVDAEAMKAIRKTTGWRMTKRPNTYGPYPSTQFDLDGDGTFEVLMSMEGMELELFRSDGTEVASLGCYMG
jgi:hypothetical protein